MMSKKPDNIIKNALILFLITIIAGTLLGLTYEVTKEPIRIQQEKTKNDALKAVVIEATDFAELSFDVDKNYSGIENIYIAKSSDEIVGYAFEMTATEGYGGNITLMVGIDNDHHVLGIDIIKHNETPGLGAKVDEDGFKSEFVEEATEDLSVVKVTPSDTPGEISAISGATISSRSVTNAVNVAIDYYNNHIAEVK